MSVHENSITPSEKYILRCLGCGRAYSDEHYRLKCETCDSGNCDSLLRTEYAEKKFEAVKGRGLFKYASWLPVKEELDITSSPITYKSHNLAKYLGLERLYIGFSGYWPERKAETLTCTFKEYEAFPTLVRFKEAKGNALVLASAGNTGRAFAYASDILGVPVIIVVPESALHHMWSPQKPKQKINLICLKNGDYSDAIELAERISKTKDIHQEGGARNVARRDGMGVVMLEGVNKMKSIPDHYFQSIGSGTGALSAWEACLRLMNEGRYGQRLPMFQLSQNLPFSPMYYAWKGQRRKIIAQKDMPDAKDQIRKLYAEELSNRLPPYSIKGGIFDLLKKCGGTIFAITNDEAKEARDIFESEERIDIVPAAAVAVASLIKAVREKKVSQKDRIFLNITGGGEKRLKKEREIYMIKPSKYIENINADIGQIL
jgi:cysteate synthase